MHLNGISNRLEIQRPKMRNTLRKEAILLPDDLGRNLQDSTRALIERTHQPGRIL
jgi:hypothetical protein